MRLEKMTSFTEQGGIQELTGLTAYPNVPQGRRLSRSPRRRHFFHRQGYKRSQPNGSQSDGQAGPQESMEHRTNKVFLVDLGSVGYQKAWNLQHRIHQAKQAGLSADLALLLEHPHVFTLGKTAKKENILVPETFLRMQGIDCVSIERGGDGPFQGAGHTP